MTHDPHGPPPSDNEPGRERPEGCCDGLQKAGWQGALEERFRQWLQELDADPLTADHTALDGPDLYAFYEALCVLRSEVRHQARRSHDVLNRFSDTLNDFDGLLRTLNERMVQIDEQRGGLDDAGVHTLFLSLIELFERFQRIQGRLETPPKTGWLSSRRRWTSAWSALQEGFDILNDHFQQLLQHHGIVILECEGRPFDPTLMKAVEVEQSDAAAPNTVLAQLAGGYTYRERVLKFAEVKIAVGKETR